MRLVVDAVSMVTGVTPQLVRYWQALGLLYVVRDDIDGEELWDEWHVFAVSALLAVRASDEDLASPGWRSAALNSRLHACQLTDGLRRSFPDPRWLLTTGEIVTDRYEGRGAAHVETTDWVTVEAVPLAALFATVRDTLETRYAATAF